LIFERTARCCWTKSGKRAKTPARLRTGNHRPSGKICARKGRWVAICTSNARVRFARHTCEEWQDSRASGGNPQRPHRGGKRKAWPSAIRRPGQWLKPGTAAPLPGLPYRQDGGVTVVFREGASVSPALNHLANLGTLFERQRKRRKLPTNGPLGQKKQVKSTSS